MAEAQVITLDTGSKVDDSNIKAKAHQAVLEVDTVLRCLVASLEEEGTATGNEAKTGLAILLNDQARKLQYVMQVPGFDQWSQGYAFSILA